MAPRKGNVLTRTQVTGIKKMGWDGISLTESSFKGGVRTFNGHAVVFTDCLAYIVADENGEYNAADVMEYIIKAGSALDIEDLAPDVFVLAELPEEESNRAGSFIAEDVQFNTFTMEEYGLNTQEFKEEAVKRLLALQPFGRTVDFM